MYRESKDMNSKIDKERAFKGRSMDGWKRSFPLLQQIMEPTPVLWLNPGYNKPTQTGSTLSEREVRDAEQRLARFAPYLAKAFPETEKDQGIIESPLLNINSAKAELERNYSVSISKNLWLKADHELPISGSIKARGGIYEVLKHAETLAIDKGMLREGEDYSLLDGENFNSFFSSYKITVASTGNLGLSIGVIGAKLGFQVTVHMSADAKQWKKDLLREKGVHVIEHESDYTSAVNEGRNQAARDPMDYFVDDEYSESLFLGYAVAAYRLKEQCKEQGIEVSANHPLFVYLPCGVGGGPGGVAFGLKQVFGEHVHCFFVEPTHSACMLIGMMTGEHSRLSVQDFGLDNKTIADGLAVGTASAFVGKIMEPLLTGIATVEDSELYKLQALLIDSEDIRLEPSAAAGFAGLLQVLTNTDGRGELLRNRMDQATHLIWATGGSMVPKEQMDQDYEIGKKLWEEKGKGV